MASVSSGDENSQDVELNLAPIIDCFMVLITFLLVSASYVSLFILDVTLAPVAQEVPITENEEPPPPQEEAEKKKEVQVEIELKTDGTLVTSISGAETNTVTLTRSLAGQKDPQQVRQFEEQMKALKEKWSDTKKVTVKGEGKVPYWELVWVMESVRPIFPEVMLGGF